MKRVKLKELFGQCKRKKENLNKKVYMLSKKNMAIQELLEFTKNNIIGILAIIVAIIIFYFQRKNKKINLSIIYNGKIINSNNSIVNKKLSIKFGDKEISDLGLLIFELKNTGNLVIDKNDFIDNKDLIIEFNGGDLLVSNLKETTPDYLKEEVLYDIFDNKLLIKPFTINIGDSLIFEILADGNIEKIIPKPRIRGINEFKKINFNLEKLKYFVLIFIFMNLIYFIKFYDKAVYQNKTIMEVFKDTETIHNNLLKIIYYILPLIVLYFMYKFIKLEIISDKLRGRVKRENSIKNLINRIIPK